MGINGPKTCHLPLLLQELTGRQTLAAASGSCVATGASGTKPSMEWVEETMPMLAFFFRHRGCDSSLCQVEKIQAVVVRIRFLIIRRYPHALQAISPAAHSSLADCRIET